MSQPVTAPARWCGYCQHALGACTCPPWMPNTGSDAERAARGLRQQQEREAHRAAANRQNALLEQPAVFVGMSNDEEPMAVYRGVAL